MAHLFPAQNAWARYRRLLNTDDFARQRDALKATVALVAHSQSDLQLQVSLSAACNTPISSLARPGRLRRLLQRRQPKRYQRHLGASMFRQKTPARVRERSSLDRCVDLAV